MESTFLNLGPRHLDIPDWLVKINAQNMVQQPFPLREILTGSFYYPSCGTDGGPVRNLSQWYQSFVYVDYGYKRESFLEELRVNPFSGYRVIGMRTVSKSELAPLGWGQLALTRVEFEQAQWRENYQRHMKFCEWVVFERTEQVPISHGPKRFSMLFLSADGVQAFNALYVGNDLKPGAIAVIQPGYGFGGNWTDFTNIKAPLARVVMANPAGLPTHYLSGGWDRRKYLSKPWPVYTTHLGWYQYHTRNVKGSVGVWKA